MKAKEKCLVSEAMDKCQCEWCKLFRGMREISLKQAIEMEAWRIYIDSLKKAKII